MALPLPELPFGAQSRTAANIEASHLLLPRKPIALSPWASRAERFIYSFRLCGAQPVVLSHSGHTKPCGQRSRYRECWHFSSLPHCWHSLPARQQSRSLRIRRAARRSRRAGQSAPHCRVMGVPPICRMDDPPTGLCRQHHRGTAAQPGRRTTRPRPPTLHADPWQRCAHPA